MKKTIAVILILMMIMSVLPAVSADTPKLVALTFDDGPGRYTERLLDGLAEKDVRATFFCLGSCAEQYPDTIRRIVADGHQLANHSRSHPNLNELTVDAAVSQITGTDQILNRITGGSESYYFRPPYGNSTQAIRDRMAAPAVIWSVDTIDWRLLNREAVKNKILADTFDGAIVLMHDIHSTTVDGILDAIDTLRYRGYEFVTVKELVRRRGIAVSAGSLLYSCKPNGMDLGSLKMPEVSVSGESGVIEICLQSPDGAPIYYSLDGSPVLPDNAQLYSEPVKVPLPCILRAVSAWDLNGDRSREYFEEYILPPTGDAHAVSEKGNLCFVTAAPEDIVYVSFDTADPYLTGVPADEVDIPRDTSFSYYACADGFAPTGVTTLLYSAEGNLFSDIQQNDWYYLVMDHCVSEGYYLPAQDYSLRPAEKLSRAMLVELLYRQSGETVEAGELPFTDVPESAYYYNALFWAYENGIVNGVGNNIFAPDRMVSRQELAKILSLYLELPAEPADTVYLDQERIADWALEHVQAVTSAGLMQGSSGWFHPKGTATRAEMAALLFRMDEREA